MDKENIAKFRKALREGSVAFSYKKKDGTIREALGTMCDKLLPKTELSAAFKCTEIEYDTDGEDVKLPKRMTVRIPFSEYSDMSDEEAEECIGDIIAESTGFCLKSFRYEAVPADKPKKQLPDGAVFYYDLDKKGYRSFNESQLIDWSL